MILTAILLFFVQALNYCLLTINYRACAHGHVKTMIFTDGLVASLGFFVIQHIAAIGGTAIVPWVGYTLGGMLGSVIGMYISKKLH